MQDNLFEILLNLNINDLYQVYFTNQTFNKIITSQHFWTVYFAKYNLSNPIPEKTVNQWVRLFINMMADKMVNNMEQTDYSEISTIVLDFTSLDKILIEDVSQNDKMKKHFANQVGNGIQVTLMYAKTNHGFILDVMVFLDKKMIRTTPFYLTKEMARQYLVAFITHRLINIDDY